MPQLAVIVFLVERSTPSDTRLPRNSPGLTSLSPTTFCTPTGHVLMCSTGLPKTICPPKKASQVPPPASFFCVLVSGEMHLTRCLALIFDGSLCRQAGGRIMGQLMT